MNRTQRRIWRRRTRSFVTTAAVLALGSGQAMASCATGNIDAAETTPCVMPAGQDFAVSPTGSVTVNNAYGLTNNGGTVGKILNEGTLSASGLIGPRKAAAIHIRGGGGVTGGIVNTGHITGSAAGIEVGNSLGGGRVENGILNSGLIDTANYGILVNSYASSVVGDIVNDAQGRVLNAGGSGIVNNGGVLTGNVINRGLIDVGYSALSIGGDVSGSVINAGQLLGHDSYYGTAYIWGILRGDFVNQASGSIIGAAYGGVDLSESTILGSVRNDGLIQGTGSAGLYTYDNLLEGGIRNTGRISGSGPSSYGVMTDYGSRIHNGIVNNGVIDGVAGAIYLTESEVDGGLSNTGTISTVGSAAIELAGGSTLDHIDNSGTIAGGTYAIRAPGGLPLINIQGNASRLVGDVLAPETDVVLKSGATFGNTNAFDVGSFTVENGALMNLGAGPRTAGSLVGQDGIKVANGFTNNGTVAVAAGAAPTLTGDYAQSAGGTFRIGLTDTTSNYGKLAVTGNAALASGTTVDVKIASGASIRSGSTVQGVITAGGTLTATPSAITVTDNSVLYNFTASTARDAHALDLVTTVDPTGITSAAGTGPASGSAGALQTQLNNASAAMQPVFDRMSAMSTAQVSDALSQTLPAIQGAGSQAAVNALHTMNKVIQARIEGSKGLSSGDTLAERDGYLWARAFGNRGDQDSFRGADGFRSSTNGLILGVDLPTSDRLRAGLAFTVAHSNITANSSIAPSHVDVNSYNLIGYASYNLDPATDINYQLDIGRNSAKSQRDIGFMGSTARASFDSLAVHGGVGIGRLLTLSEVSNLTPSLRLDYTQLRTDGYTEDGAGPLNLAVAGQTFRELVASADAKFVYNFRPGLRFVGNGGVGYDFKNEGIQTVAAFTGGGPVFTTQGLQPSPWLYRAGLGLSSDSSQGMEYTVRYDLEGRPSGYRNQTLSARVRWRF